MNENAVKQSGKAQDLKSSSDSPGTTTSFTDAQKSYLQNLEDQRVSLIHRFESTPQSIANKHLRWRIAADIE